MQSLHNAGKLISEQTPCKLTPLLQIAINPPTLPLNPAIRITTFTQCTLLASQLHTTTASTTRYVRGVIKNYGECCCWMRSNGKAGIFNMGSGMSNLSNSVWQVSTCSVQSVGCELRL